MSNFKINIERDSVSMGDDISAPHLYSFTLPKTAVLRELFEHLADKHYLASVAGTDHSWEAILGHEVLAVIQGNNPLPEPSERLRFELNYFAKENELNVYFKYKSAAR